jgi:hypothetical protein
VFVLAVVVLGLAALLINRFDNDTYGRLRPSARQQTRATIAVVAAIAGMIRVIIWGALLIAGALPVWTGDDPSTTGLWLSGVAVMVCGVFDHRLFVRTLGPPALAAHARA